MPNIKPVSDLRNYNEVLQDVAIDEPVFLTKNGRGRYAILDIEDYQKIQATIKLLKKLSEAESSVKDGDWLTTEETERELGI
jgi:prevent-host-death family protein